MLVMVKRERKQHRVRPVLSRDDKDAFYVAKLRLLEDQALDKVKVANPVRFRS